MTSITEIIELFKEKHQDKLDEQFLKVQQLTEQLLKKDELITRLEKQEKKLRTKIEEQLKKKVREQLLKILFPKKQASNDPAVFFEKGLPKSSKKKSSHSGWSTGDFERWS